MNENLHYGPVAGVRFGLEAGKLELCPLEQEPQGDVVPEQAEEEQAEGEPEKPESVGHADGQAPALPEARGAKVVAPPSEEEVKTHELMHANYKPWCEHRAAGRGQDAKHLHVQAESHRTRWSYRWATCSSLPMALCRRPSESPLVTIDDRGVVEACVCTKMGPQDLYAIKAMTKYLGGLGAKKLVL